MKNMIPTNSGLTSYIATRICLLAIYHAIIQFIRAQSYLKRIDIQPELQPCIQLQLQQNCKVQIQLETQPCSCLSMAAQLQSKVKFHYGQDFYIFIQVQLAIDVTNSACCMLACQLFACQSFMHGLLSTYIYSYLCDPA